MFEQVDEDKSGELSVDELMGLMHMLEVEIDNGEHIDELLDVVDTDTDNVVSKEEFRVWYEKVMG